MQAEEIDRILRHTLSDYRMSRGEKRVLRQILEEMQADHGDLAWLRSRVFEVAREQIKESGAEDVLGWLEEAVKVFSTLPDQGLKPRSEAYFTPGDNGPRKLAGLFNTTQRGADICIFTITDDRVTDAILAAHIRGAKIRIISDNDKAFDPGSDIDRLRRGGVSVRVDRTPDHMHHKFAVFDNATLLTGSYNWTRSAAERNAENFVVLSDARLTEEFSREFQRLWDEFG